MTTEPDGDPEFSAVFTTPDGRRFDLVRVEQEEGDRLTLYGRDADGVVWRFRGMLLESEEAGEAEEVNRPDWN
jgi:hypothetical protein